MIEPTDAMREKAREIADRDWFRTEVGRRGLTGAIAHAIAAAVEEARRAERRRCLSLCEGAVTDPEDLEVLRAGFDAMEPKP